MCLLISGLGDLVFVSWSFSSRVGELEGEGSLCYVLSLLVVAHTVADLIL